MTVEFKGLRCHSAAIPFVPVDHPNFVWRGPADVDVQRTWKTYGWSPSGKDSGKPWTCPPCNNDCYQGRWCPAQPSHKYAS